MSENAGSDRRDTHLAWVKWYDERIAAAKSAIDGLRVARTTHVDAIREINDKQQ